MYNARSTSKRKSANVSNSAALYSAALQDHFLKKINFDLDFKIGSHKKFGNQKLPSIVKKNQRPQQKQKEKEMVKLAEKQKSSILPYENESLRRLKEARNDEQKIQKYNKKLTLAQKLGIVQKPPMPLTAKDWSQIQQKSKQRNDSESICSICLQDFKVQAQVILSCSHVFHNKCLSSFEKHNKAHCCPICRKQNYEKKFIDEAIRIFTLKCIIRIQRVYRGSRDRIKTYGKLFQTGYVCQSKLFNRRMIGFKMWRLSNKIQDKIKKDFQEYRKMIKDIESKYKSQTEEILEQMVRIQRQKVINEGIIDDYLHKIGVQREQKPQKIHSHNHNWDQIMKKGAQRAGHDEQCSICLMALWSKPVYLLSCTHTFHVNCIQGFERYSLPGSKNKCPCCRSQYEKKVVQKNK